ncbi:multidrug ABC transporter ATP-binding protein [Longimonas halophila]|uniref:Multidrug ABC transporter ATP-binding protein n=1 Tax=Longimonas halophila TaxID=1469170 RepID=A0A2H3P0H7_9BACT|nr:ABC transporter ATP-binding protein [Longimonas halophila]PEN08853.1 multidrug ABC transporter ATP-binding protein [Longimonas halophila]
MSLSVERVAEQAQHVRERLAYLPRALRMTWNATRGWTLAWAVLLVLQGLLPTASVYLTKVLVDRIAEALNMGLSWETAAPVLTPAALMAGIMVTLEVLKAVGAWVQTAQAELLHDHIKAAIHEKAAEVAYAFYESPAYYDTMDRANSEAASRSLSLLQGIGTIAQHTITLVGVAALLIPYSVWLPGVLLVSTLPALWVVVRHKQRHHSWWEDTTDQRRWAHYFDRVVTHPVPAAEVRLFGLGERFRSAYTSVRETLRTDRLRLMRDQSLATFGAGLTALVITGGALLWIGARALQGQAQLGDLALFYRAFDQGQSLMRTVLSSLGTLYADALFLEHLFTFLDIESSTETAHKTPVPVPQTVQHGITFEGVGFRYPGSDAWVLRDFSLHLPAGATVAVVGANGAGKSTLLKLMCRFYDPQEGRILLDGTDLRDFDPTPLRRRIAVMFQYPVQYIATAANNIALGDVQVDRSDAEVRSAVQRAAQGAGADAFIQELPHGYDTLLSKQFDGGVELSGGQWQRISLARAFYREAPIVILDEPTSFMDSWAEAAWLDRFRTLVDGRTALIITHRFTTAMRADHIIVMEHGQIVEQGAHEVLLDQGGRYAQSWRTQTEHRAPRRHTATAFQTSPPFSASIS